MDTTNEPTYPPDPISPKEAAKLLGVHLSAVYRWCLTGKLPYWSLPSGHKRVSRADVLALPKPGTPRQGPAFRIPSIHDQERRRRETMESLRRHGII